MPLEGIFIQPSSNSNSVVAPDLSLNISLSPNTASSSSSSSISNSTPTTTTTELSLAHLSTTVAAGERPRSHPYLHHHPNAHLSHINHGVSSLDVSDGLRPIKGIPVYHNRTFPFLPLDHHNRDNRDPKLSSLYQMPYPPPWSSPLSPSSSSSSLSHSPASSPYFGAGFDPYRLAGTPRLNGLSSSYQLHHHHNHHQYGVGPSHEAPHGLMRSRFMPKLPTKRSMRAPRMRWTSSLHARFVHAVELLGGHESTRFALLLC